MATALMLAAGAALSAGAQSGQGAGRAAAELFGSGWTAYGLILLAGFAVTEPWRWAGVIFSKNLSLDSEILIWVRAVSTALVAGLVTRMVIFAPGALEGVPLWLRVLAFAAGIAAYYLGRRILAVGIGGGVLVLIAGQLWL